MNLPKAAREELERREAVEAVVYVDDPDHRPMTPEQKRLVRAALAEHGITQIRVVRVPHA
jgi:cation transport regulator ChaC